MTTRRKILVKIVCPTLFTGVQRERLYTLLEKCSGVPVAWISPPSQKKTLPLLTPEHLAGIPIFTGSYLETLYSCLLPRSVTVQTTPAHVMQLDNFQDVSATSPLHDMIATELATSTDDPRVVVLSRSKLPPD